MIRIFDCKMSYKLSSVNILPKGERLCAQKQIDKLFSEGKSFICYPLRVVYLEKELGEGEAVGVSMMVTVSKKYFKRAVKRNRVKRLIKEVYRLNKSEFLDLANTSNCSIDIAFLFLKSELPDYAEVEKAMRKCINTLQEKSKKMVE